MKYLLTAALALFATTATAEDFCFNVADFAEAMMFARQLGDDLDYVLSNIDPSDVTANLKTEIIMTAYDLPQESRYGEGLEAIRNYGTFWLIECLSAQG